MECVGLPTHLTRPIQSAFLDQIRRPVSRSVAVGVFHGDLNCAWPGATKPRQFQGTGGSLATRGVDLSSYEKPTSTFKDMTLIYVERTRRYWTTQYH
jgi:hypothetical protein